MNYDENVFKAKANIKARRIWLVFSLLLTANYGADMSNGFTFSTVSIHRSSISILFCSAGFHFLLENYF